MFSILILSLFDNVVTYRLHSWFRLHSLHHSLVKVLVKIEIHYTNGSLNCVYCVSLRSIRRVRRGESQTTAVWISLRWNGRTKMILYVLNP